VTLLAESWPLGQKCVLVPRSSGSPGPSAETAHRVGPLWHTACPPVPSEGGAIVCQAKEAREIAMNSDLGMPYASPLISYQASGTE